MRAIRGAADREGLETKKELARRMAALIEIRGATRAWVMAAALAAAKQSAGGCDSFRTGPVIAASLNERREFSCTRCCC